MKNSRVSGSEYIRKKADEVRGNRRHKETQRSLHYEDFKILLSKMWYQNRQDYLRKKS